MPSPKNSAIELQERDFAILRSLFESRLMTLAHMAALHFEGRNEAAKKRIQKLKATGLVTERSRRMYEPSILFLTRKAFQILEKNGILKNYPPLGLSSLEKRAQVSDLTLRHELAVMDVKAAFAKAISAASGFSIVEFITWPLLCEFTACRPDGSRKEVLVRPDGFVRIQEQNAEDIFEHTLFLEVDRSTETQETLAMRAGCYVDYYRRGGLAARFGRPREELKDFPFRVLVVCKTAERRNNAAERMLKINPPILSMVWLTTMQEILHNPFGAIWIRPVDYRDATQNTLFATENRQYGSGYKTQPERETLVERKVQKVSLTDG
jgi:hypothetical protein